MSKIIATNFRATGSDYKWVLGTEKNGLNDSIGYKVIHATSARFENPTDDEKKLGCSFVIKCNNARGYDKKDIHNDLEIKLEKYISLNFNGKYFEDLNKQIVHTADSLFLDAEGNIFAQI